MLRRVVFLSLVSFGLTSSVAFSEVIDISDCDGNQIAVNEISSGTFATVSATLDNLPSVATGDVTLVNQESGESLEFVRAANGSITFSDVPSGSWKLCGEKVSAISDVAIVNESGLTNVAAPITAGVAVVGAAFAMSDSSSSSSNSGSSAETSSGPTTLVEDEINTPEEIAAGDAEQESGHGSDSDSSVGASSSGSEDPCTFKIGNPCGEVGKNDEEEGSGTNRPPATPDEGFPDDFTPPDPGISAFR